MNRVNENNSVQELMASIDETGLSRIEGMFERAVAGMDLGGEVDKVAEDVQLQFSTMSMSNFIS
jgi:hypothetical protein